MRWGVLPTDELIFEKDGKKQKKPKKNFQKVSSRKASGLIGSLSRGYFNFMIVLIRWYFSMIMYNIYCTQFMKHLSTVPDKFNF